MDLPVHHPIGAFDPRSTIPHGPVSIKVRERHPVSTRDFCYSSHAVRQVKECDLADILAVKPEAFNSSRALETAL